jgi:hypothetical protein
LYLLLQVIKATVAFRGVFSDLSLAFKDRFDIIAGITYSLVVVRRSFSFIQIRFANSSEQQGSRRIRRPRGADSQPSGKTTAAEGDSEIHGGGS